MFTAHKISTGSASLVDEATYKPKIAVFDSVAQTVAALRSVGHRVVLVSSGAVALGRGSLDLQKTNLPKAMAKVCYNFKEKISNPDYSLLVFRPSPLLVRRC